MSNSPSQETVTMTIARIGERFAPLRIVEPQAERAMLHSMEKYGQLTPVAVCRIAPGEQELLDGFKRLRAARQLGLAELSARPFDLTIRAGKATMLQLNRVGRAISGMEAAPVVHSLCHEDGLNQVEIHHQVPEDRKTAGAVLLLHPGLLPAPVHRLHPRRDSSP